MSQNLLIVESPTKAKTISRFLDSSFSIVSSYGHIRDLPEKEMGIDIKNNFEPKYVIPLKSKKHVEEIKKKALKAGIVYFATDEDREGEAIAWHLLYILDQADDKQLNNSVNYQRIVFHEITENAIKTALKNARQIDFNLVNAQQARRILDRLVGYELSPFLWKKVAKGLSAGRVQSVAVRLIVEREREIENFKPEEYWTVEAELEKQKNKEDIKKYRNKEIKIIARLHKIDDKVLNKLFIKNKQEADEILNDLKNGKYIVQKIEKKQTKRNPLPPFTTSTLQQEASKKLGFSAKQTMLVAQQLYEGVALGEKGEIGLITYMRTDSFNLAEDFLNNARDFIQNNFSEKYLPNKPNFYRTKSKSAQEAHEAIRPTDINLKPNDIKNYLDSKQFKLYDLIWKRALACQMQPAVFDSTIVDINTDSNGSNADKHRYIFRATGSVIKFDGFLKVYPDSTKDNLLPELTEKEKLDLKKITPEQHFTEPPARYSDASLIKKLEELGIGRPSTYAPTISTIISRGYIRREAKRFVPQDIAKVVNDLLVKHFPETVDYKFTAQMEDELDEIASGKLKWQPVIKKFYTPFKENLILKTKEIKKADLINEKSDEVCEKCGSPMIIKTGRYGKFLACSAFPKCKNTKPLENNKNQEKNNDAGKNNNAGGQDELELNSQDEKCPECGKEMVIKQSRYGKFLACSGYPECKYIKNNFSTGVTCPKCNQGKIMIRKTRTKKTFYGCSNYPNCDFALWQKPIVDPESTEGQGIKCPQCNSLLVESGKDENKKIKCSDKECVFEKKE